MRSKNLCVLAIVALFACMTASTASATTIYDHFDGAELDTGLWTITSSFADGAATVADSNLTVSASGGGYGLGGGWITLAGTGTNSYDGYSFKLGGNMTGINLFGLESGAGNDARRIVVRNDLTGGAQYVFQTYAGPAYPANAVNTGIGQLAAGDVVGIDWKAGEASVYVNGLLAATHTSGIPSTDMPYFIGAGDTNSLSIGIYDYVASGGFEIIPEPSTLVLLATGLIGLICYAWRKRK